MKRSPLVLLSLAVLATSCRTLPTAPAQEAAPELGALAVPRPSELPAVQSVVVTSDERNAYLVATFAGALPRDGWAWQLHVNADQAPNWYDPAWGTDFVVRQVERHGAHCPVRFAFPSGIPEQGGFGPETGRARVLEVAQNTVRAVVPLDAMILEALIPEDGNFNFVFVTVEDDALRDAVHGICAAGSDDPVLVAR